MDVSVVVPLFNEIENVRPLHDSLTAVMRELHVRYELILVDDGSRDGTAQRLREIAAADPCVKVVLFRSNFGQTAALSAGLRYASGDAVVTLDGDLQNDPADIPMMLAKLDEGFDFVHGWRKDRQDALVHRKIPSRIANRLIAKVTGVAVHDLGCALKAMRGEIARELRLYGEMHRFITILAARNGARCCEVVTRHHARRHGASKYGLSRTVRVVLDLITVYYLTRHLRSPMRLFGAAGLTCGAAGAFAGVTTVGMKIFGGVDMTGNPLLMLTVLSAMLGVQFLALGLLGELGTRIFYEVRGGEPYAVRETLNFETPDTIVRRAA
jgi:glycosyltransferase involved in cell wall biosynthesis